MAIHLENQLQSPDYDTVLSSNKYQFSEFLKQRSSFIVIGIVWSKQLVSGHNL